MTLPRNATLVVLAGLMLGGCAAREDFAYVDASEIPPGEGLFTNKSGKFELLSIDTGGPALQPDEASTVVKEPERRTPAAKGGAAPNGLSPDKRWRK